MLTNDVVSFEQPGPGDLFSCSDSNESSLTYIKCRMGLTKLLKCFCHPKFRIKTNCSYAAFTMIIPKDRNGRANSVHLDQRAPFS